MKTPSYSNIEAFFSRELTPAEQSSFTDFCERANNCGFDIHSIVISHDPKSNETFVSCTVDADSLKSVQSQENQVFDFLKKMGANMVNSSSWSLTGGIRWKKE
ncbi:hypothetical protein D6827_02885 [Candidatus Parcubacteria bacterium]|nr:MAG: hypothetical protein D6827_02885 [Candidatus Parcubacteria bacterium]